MQGHIVCMAPQPSAFC